MRMVTQANVVRHQPKGASLRIVREIGAPLAEVFRAWTDPHAMAKWMAPNAGLVTRVVADLRPGGEYRIHGLHGDGRSFRVSGTYLVVEPPINVEMTWCYVGPVNSMRGASRVIAHFMASTTSSTRFTLTHERTMAARRANPDRLREGTVVT